MQENAFTRILFSSGKINKIAVGTVKGLQDIHKYIFQDKFEHDGKIRNVNISKGNFRFVASVFLKDTLKTIEKLPEKTFNQIIVKYVEMNIAHFPLFFESYWIQFNCNTFLTRIGSK